MSNKISQRVMDNYKKSTVILFTQMVMTFILFVYEASYSKSIFSLLFILKVLGFLMLYKFFFKAQKSRDYAFWGISLIVGLYLVQTILHYTFIHYNAPILYLSFMAIAFLAICSYAMSSPLYFPRVQWWEYDYRYRGDIKVNVKYNNLELEGRISDLRREVVCIELFEILELGVAIQIEIVKHDKPYKLTGNLVTMKRTIPGRPFRYGVTLDTDNDEIKKEYDLLKEVWDSSKKVKIRKKFDL